MNSTNALLGIAAVSIFCLYAPQGQAAEEFRLDSSNYVHRIAFEPDGKILLASTGLKRLNTDGTPDDTFCGPFNCSRVDVFAVEETGAILQDGFCTGNGLGLRRLLKNCTWDPAFTPGQTLTVQALIPQPDGRLLMVGGQQLKRLNPDGTLDPGFSSAIPLWIGCLAMQEDGKIIVAHSTSQTLFRLNENGSLDPTFTSAVQGYADSLVVQPDGKIIAGLDLGWGVVRLQPDGSLDQTFMAPTNATGDLYWSMLLQTDGKIIVEGYFRSLGGQSCTNLGRLNPDGTLDPTFPLTSDHVEHLAIQADGALLSLRLQSEPSGGVTNTIIQRRTNSGPATETLTYRDSRITWLRGGTSPEVWRTRFSYSLNGADWIDLGPGTRVPGGWQLDGISVPPASTLRARGYVLNITGRPTQTGSSAWHVESRRFIPAEGPTILLEQGSPGCGTGRTVFKYCGSPGKTVVIEASTDLRHWMGIHTNIADSASLQFEDPESATLPTRFYRVREER